MYTYTNILSSCKHKVFWLFKSECWSKQWEIKIVEIKGKQTEIEGKEGEKVELFLQHGLIIPRGFESC